MTESPRGIQAYLVASKPLWNKEGPIKQMNQCIQTIPFTKLMVNFQGDAVSAVVAQLTFPQWLLVFMSVDLTISASSFNS